MLAYLWALVGVNEGRAAGGEKGVLKEQAISEGACLSTACSSAHGASSQLMQVCKSASASNDLRAGVFYGSCKRFVRH